MKSQIKTAFYCDVCKQYFPDKVEFILHCSILSEKKTGKGRQVRHDWSSINPDHEVMQRVENE